MIARERMGAAFIDSRDLETFAISAEKFGSYRLWLTADERFSDTQLLLKRVANSTSKMRIALHREGATGATYRVLNNPMMTGFFPSRLDVLLGTPSSKPSSTDGRAGTPSAIGRLRDKLISFFDPVSEYEQQSDLPIFILGSTIHASQIAAGLGFPFVYGQHISDNEKTFAIASYKRNFQSSPALSKPYLVLAIDFESLIAERDLEGKPTNETIDIVIDRQHLRRALLETILESRPSEIVFLLARTSFLHPETQARLIAEAMEGL